MKTTEININNAIVIGYEIELQNAKLILAVAPKGYVMCGYLNMAGAEKLSDLAAIIKGVNSIEDLLSKPVSEVSRLAAASGIKAGMTGREALSLLV
jgi:uncharacterized protein YunC (DUF1805 family)